MKRSRAVGHAVVLCAFVAGTLVAVGDPATAGTYRSTQSAVFFAGAPGLKHAQRITTIFTIPKFSCGATETSGISAGATVWDGTHLSSTAAGTVFFVLECSKGKATTETKMNINGKWTTPALTTHPRDLLGLSIQQSPSKTTLKLVDLTTRKSTSRTGPGAATPNYAAIGVSTIQKKGSTVPEPVVRFGHVTFTATTVNGVDLGTWGTSKYLLYGGSKSPPPASAHLLVDVSTLSSKTTFTCTFKHAS